MESQAMNLRPMGVRLLAIKTNVLEIVPLDAGKYAKHIVQTDRTTFVVVESSGTARVSGVGSDSQDVPEAIQGAGMPPGGGWNGRGANTPSCRSSASRGPSEARVEALRPYL